MNLITHMTEIHNKEHFAVEFLFPDGHMVPGALQITGMRSFTKAFDCAASGNWTVADWVLNRFKTLYPEFICNVLFDDGKQASGKTKLSDVRASYEEA